MSTTDNKTPVNAIIYQQPEWRTVFDVVLISVVMVFLMVAFVMLFLRRKNIPINQSIEVDPREPHSITITFVPAASSLKDVATTVSTEVAMDTARTTESSSAIQDPTASTA